MDNPGFGQPWRSAGRFSDYNSADELRKSIQFEIDEKKREGAQVKIKRMADDTFVVKVREPREEKKTKKKRKSTKNK
jgi:hypothetical protein